MAVVNILNSKTAKAEWVMILVRAIVKWSLGYSFHINAVHVSSDNNGIADSISRKHWQRFKLLAPAADQQPIAVSTEFRVLEPFASEVDRLLSASLFVNTAK